MNGCEAYDDLLSAMADGELSGAEREDSARHTVGCARCAAELASLRALKTAVAEADSPPIPAELLRALLQQARRSVPRERMSFDGLWLRWSLAAACAAAGVLMIVTDSSDERTISFGTMLAEHERYANALPLMEDEDVD